METRKTGLLCGPLTFPQIQPPPMSLNLLFFSAHALCSASWIPTFLTLSEGSTTVKLLAQGSSSLDFNKYWLRNSAAGKLGTPCCQTDTRLWIHVLTLKYLFYLNEAKWKYLWRDFENDWRKTWENWVAAFGPEVRQVWCLTLTSSWFFGGYALVLSPRCGLLSWDCL